MLLMTKNHVIYINTSQGQGRNYTLSKSVVSNKKFLFVQGGGISFSICLQFENILQLK